MAAKKDPVVLGVDPGFASFGWAVVRLSSPPKVLSAGVIRTAKSPRRAKVLATEDNLARARKLHRALAVVAETSQEPIGAVCAESMSWPRNAGAAAKVAIAWGVLAAFTEERQLAVLQASPQHVKEALCGRRDASKEEVAARVDALTERSAARAMDEAGVPASQREHPYDAAAVAISVADADVVRLLRG